MAVRPVDLQAPLPQVDEVARIQRIPQAASEREASATVVQGQPEVRERQRDVPHSPDVTPEEADSERRRRPRERAGPKGRGAGGKGPPAQENGPAGPDEPPSKGAHLDVRGN